MIAAYYHFMMDELVITKLSDMTHLKGKNDNSFLPLLHHKANIIR